MGKQERWRQIAINNGASLQDVPEYHALKRQGWYVTYIEAKKDLDGQLYILVRFERITEDGEASLASGAD